MIQFLRLMLRMGRITKADLAAAVESGARTAAEYEAITGEEYAA